MVLRVQVLDMTECFIAIELDLKRIAELHLTVTPMTVREAILALPKLKIKECDLVIESDAVLKVLAGRASRDDNALFELHRLRQAVKSVIVCGIKDVSRAIITLKEEGEKTKEEKASGIPCHRLLVEGLGLQAVMGVSGVAGKRTRSTHIMEVEKTLGIEAARQTIIDEIEVTMSHHGMDIDSRHVSLLADTMCFRGEVLATAEIRPAEITRERGRDLAEITREHDRDLAEITRERGRGLAEIIPERGRALAEL